MKKDMPLEGLRWSRDSGSALYDTPPKRPFSDGLGGNLSVCSYYICMMSNGKSISIKCISIL